MMVPGIFTPAVTLRLPMVHPANYIAMERRELVSCGCRSE